MIDKLRYLLGFVCLAAMMAVISACGSSVSTATPATPTAAPTTTTSSPTTTSAAATSATATSTTSSGGSAAPSLQEGAMIVKNTCGACHTLAAAGVHGTVGPNLDHAMPSMQCVVQQVTHGGAVKPPCPPVAGSIMPSFKGTLSHNQILSVAMYVSSVAGKGG